MARGDLGHRGRPSTASPPDSLNPVRQDSSTGTFWKLKENRHPIGCDHHLLLLCASGLSHFIFTGSFYQPRLTSDLDCLLAKVLYQWRK